MNATEAATPKNPPTETAREFLLSRYGNYNVTPAHVEQLEARDARRQQVLIDRLTALAEEWEQYNAYEHERADYSEKLRAVLAELAKPC